MTNIIISNINCLSWRRSNTGFGFAVIVKLDCEFEDLCQLEIHLSRHDELERFILYELERFLLNELERFLLYELERFILYELERFILYELERFLLYELERFVLYELERFILEIRDSNY